MQTSYHYTTKNALLAEIDRLGLAETIKQFLTNGPTLPNNYPKRPFRWFTTCKVDNKYERMVCGHWEDSGYYTACRVAPPQMCKVLIPASMDCGKDAGHFADFSQGCTYKPARIEEEAC